MGSRPRLGVNVDHVATVRQARREKEPDPIQAAKLAERGGADGIVAHLREDRRHIQVEDIRRLSKIFKTFGLEMAATPAMVQIALQHRPSIATIVPEKREELTTESGLDVKTHRTTLQRCLEPLFSDGIPVALFIDPDSDQIQSAKQMGVSAVELNTGRYSEAKTGSERAHERDRIQRAAVIALQEGLHVHAGHGLDYLNVQPVAKILEIEEFNIGFSIVGRAISVGMVAAVEEMIRLIRQHGV